MITVRKSEERGSADFGWLKALYSFSFANYNDPRHTGFRSLLVINEDWIDPARGFPLHGHRDMEIVTYLLSGAIAHRDSMGNEAVTHAGEAQRMTAGTGIRHSEYNPSQTEHTHSFQIWILPERSGLPPSYETRRFDDAAKRGRLCPIVARDGRDGAMTIAQDATIYAAVLSHGEAVRHKIADSRHAWVQVARGAVTVNGVALAQGDGAAVSAETALDIVGGSNDAEFLLFDLS